MLTQTQIASGIAESMLAAGYVGVDAWNPDHLSQIFEDPYGIVATSFFVDWTDLHRSWPDAQGELVEIMSHALDRSEPKAWEGYLILVTPESISEEVARTLAVIKRDINRLRKLVVTGEELDSLSSLHRALLPVLPLETADAGGSSLGLLDTLPRLLADSSGIPAPTTHALIRAFLDNEPLMEAIDREVHGV